MMMLIEMFLKRVAVFRLNCSLLSLSLSSSRSSLGAHYIYLQRNCFRFKTNTHRTKKANTPRKHFCFALFSLN